MVAYVKWSVCYNYEYLSSSFVFNVNMLFLGRCNLGEMEITLQKYHKTEMICFFSYNISLLWYNILVTTWRETKSWLFLFLQREIFNFDISLKSDVKSRRQDQSIRHSSTTCLRAKKWANHKQCSSVFVSCAVQKVMLVGCDWWFLILIFL